jgi:hypothetical protein
MLDKKFGPVAGRATEPNGNGISNRDSGSINNPSRNEQQTLADLARARQHLEWRAEANDIVADWRDELRKRVARTSLKAELIGISAEEHDALVDEVAEFKRFCAAVGWLPAGRRRS